MKREKLEELKENIELNSYKYNTIGGKQKCINLKILFEILDESMKPSKIENLKSSLPDDKIVEFEGIMKDCKERLLKLRDDVAMGERI